MYVFTGYSLNLIYLYTYSKTMKYLILFLLGAGTLYGQKILDIPSHAELEQYLHARQDNIEESLYQMVLSGKIRPYKNDSFTSVYSMAEFKERGGMEKQVNFDSI